MNEPHSYVDPGFFSGQELSVVTGIGVIADLVEADIQATGHNDVVVEVHSADTVICASAEVIACGFSSGGGILSTDENSSTE